MSRMNTVNRSGFKRARPLQGNDGGLGAILQLGQDIVDMELSRAFSDTTQHQSLDCQRPTVVAPLIRVLLSQNVEPLG